MLTLVYKTCLFYHFLLSNKAAVCICAISLGGELKSDYLNLFESYTYQSDMTRILESVVIWGLFWIKAHTLENLKVGNDYKHGLMQTLPVP